MREERLLELLGERGEPLQRLARGRHVAGLEQVEEQLAHESYERRRRLGTDDAETVLAAQIFLIRHGQGRLAELRPLVLEAVERSPGLTAWRAAVPLTHHLAGDDRAARSELGRSWTRSMPCRVTSSG